MLPAHTPTPGGLLATVLDTWTARGWDPADLGHFRMDADDGTPPELDGLSDDDLDAIESLTDEDVAALGGLKPDVLAALIEAGKPLDEQGLPDPVKGVLKKERDNARAAGRARRTAEAAAAAEKARADQLQAEVDRLKKGGGAGGDGGAGGGGGADTDIEEVRRKAREEARAEANAIVLAAEIKSAAAGKFADAELAVRLVDHSKIPIGADGKPDVDAIQEQLEDILEQTPGLAAKARRRAPRPNPGQGRKTGGSTGADAGRAEAERRFGKREAAGSTSK